MLLLTFSCIICPCACIYNIIFTAAARALMDIPDLSAEDVAKKAMRVASDMCVYTNDNYRVEVIKTNDDDTSTKKKEEKPSP